jgi:hypothetical protein
VAHGFRLTVATVAVAWLSIPLGASAQLPAEQSMVEIRAKQFAHAISTGLPAGMERLVRQHFDPAITTVLTDRASPAIC